MVRALIVDDHPAVLNGLVLALRSEPGLVPLATADGVGAAVAQAKRHEPSVALLDYQLADGNGLDLCHRLKALPSPPQVIIYSGYAVEELALATKIAGADALLDKGATLEELFSVIRTVARGGTALPAMRPHQVESAALLLDPDDLPILGMRLDGATVSEIADVLQVEPEEVSRRVTAMLGRFAGS